VRSTAGRAACGRVLERPAVDRDRARAAVEQLDVVVPVGGAAVAAGGEDLRDDDAAGAAAARRRGREGKDEYREQDEQVDALHGASDPGRVDGSLAIARRPAPTVSFAESARSRCTSG
jgi:predicted  nucleic acid-binding Zn-ribbon protein